MTVMLSYRAQVAERADQALLLQVADDVDEVRLLVHEIVQEEEKAA